MNININISFHEIRENISAKMCLKRIHNMMESYEDMEKDVIRKENNIYI